VQFSGRTAPLSLNVGSRIEDVDAEIVRGPLSNLAVTGVSIVSAPDTLYVGASADLSATVTTSTSTPAQLFWTSLDPTVLEVLDSTATGVAAGTAEVVASAGAHADTTSVVVIVPAVDSVRVSPDSADVQVGQTRAYTAQLLDASGGTLTGRPLTWSTGNVQVATVNASSGVVTGVAPGVTTVRATSEGVFDEAVVRVIAPSTGGGVVSWIKNGSGDWSNPANWSPARVPAAGDTVRIEQGGDYTVTLDADATIARLVLDGTTDIASLDVGDRTLTVDGTGAGPDLEIGALGILEVFNGTVRTNDVLNGGLVQGIGAFAIIEAASFQNDGTLRVPTGGVLTLGYLGGSDVALSGTVDVDGGVLALGAGSGVIHQGGSIQGAGSLLLQTATLELAADLAIDGPSIILQGSAITTIGSEVLTIGSQSVVQILADASPAEIDADVQVDGVLYASGPDANVGALVVSQTGSVLVNDGGNASRLVTGNVESAGAILLTGVSATFGPGDAGQIINLPTGVITLAPSATAFTLDGELVNEGTIDVVSPTTLLRTDGLGTAVTANHTSSGDIEIQAGGGLLVELGGSSPVFTNTGTITLDDAGSVLEVVNVAPAVGTVANAQTGRLRGIGTVVFGSGVAGANDGVIEPGLSPGTLTWQGSIPMGSTGVIEIEIYGATPDLEHDQLNVANQLVLDGNGTLDVTATYVPAAGERLAVMTFGSRSGTFGTVSLPASLDTLWVEDFTNVVPDTLYIVAAATGTPAPVNRWTGGTGAWSVGTNWSQGTVPDAADSVVIDGTGFDTITLDTNASVRNLILGGLLGQQSLVSISPQTLTTSGASLVDVNGRLTLTGGTIDGTGTLTTVGGTVFDGTTVSVPLANSGLLRVSGAVAFNGALTNTGTLRIQGASGFNGMLTVASGWTNTGTIELTDVGSYAASLTVTSGTLVNDVGASIDVLAGGNGGRTLTAALDNRGTLTLARPLTINATNAAHTNSGLIDLTGGVLTLTQSGAGSFTNTGAVTLANDWNVTGGTLDLSAGTVSGTGVLGVTSATLDYVFASLPPTMSLNTVTVTGGLTIPIGGTLNLQSSNFASPVTVDGTLVIRQAVTLGSALATPGTLRVEGMSGFNGALTVASGWTNTGTIELTDVGSYAASLTVTSGTLLNDVLGVITSIPGTGGRAVTADVDNLGVYNVNRTLTHTGSILQRSSLAVPSGQTLAIVGDLELFAGSTTVVDGTLSTTLGCTDSGGGQITGSGSYPPCT
jgi:hypothetical protein